MITLQFEKPDARCVTYTQSTTLSSTVSLPSLSAGMFTFQGFADSTLEQPLSLPPRG
jgi:hypothetical protein